MFKKILVAVDVTKKENTDRLCVVAKELVHDATKIRLLSVIPGYGMSLVASYFPEDVQEKAKSEVKEQLEQISSTHFSGEASTDVLYGRRVQEILAEAEVWNPDIIILGARRKMSLGGQRVMGAFSTGVSDRAKCSVLIVR